MAEIILVFAVLGAVFYAVYRLTHASGKWKRWILLAVILSVVLAVIHVQPTHACQVQFSDYIASHKMANYDWGYVRHEVGACYR